MEAFTGQDLAQDSPIHLEESQWHRDEVERITRLLPTSYKHEDWSKMLDHLQSTGEHLLWPPHTDALDEFQQVLVTSPHLMPERRI